MGACRENADLWWSLLHRYPGGRWCGWRVFTRGFWRNPYVLHDSFGKYFNRLVWCRLRGCKPVYIGEGCIGDVDLEWHCFKCERPKKGPSDA